MNNFIKKFTTIVLLSVMMLFLPLVSGVKGQNEEGETQYILEEIELTGNENLSNSKVIEELGLNEGDKVRKTKVEDKVQSLKGSGFFRNVKSEMEVADGKLRLTLELQEYPVLNEYVFTGVNLINKGKLKKALKEAGVKKGEVINKKELNQGLKNISKKYEKKGYPLISTGKIQIDSSLKIEIVEGQLVSNRVEGLFSVPEETALGMIEVEKGSPVKFKDIQKSYQNLRNSIYFTSVELFPARGYKQSDIILRWKLRERTIIQEPVEAARVELTGNSLFSSAELLESAGKLPDGEVTNYDVLKALAPIYKKYVDKGYSYVDFSSRGVEDEGLVIKISEGVVSEIVIKGNTRTARRVIANKLRFSEGDVLNTDELVDSRRRLLNLKYFSKVEPKPERVDDGIKVVLNVEEKGRLNSVNGGLTWSDAGLGGNLKLSTKNLFGLGQDVSLNLSRKFSLDAKFGGSIDWKNVYYPSGFNFTKLSLYRNVDSNQGVRASFGYPLSGNLSLNMGYNADWILEDDDSKSSLTHILSADLIYDNRNNPMFPTSGTRRSLKIEKAGDFAPGLSFSQVTFTGSLFQGLPKINLAGEKKQTFAFNLELGLGIDTPKNYQPEFGGKNSIRGIDKGEASNYGFLNTEYRLQLLPGSLYVTSFVDSGLDFGSGDPFDFKASAGFEINLQLFGNLRIGGAWPLSEDFNYVPGFYFGVGTIF
ncbi:BamA/TamA family outer membrane protein [Candidatus Bipolaricaulota bacterium]|nr:BamA/TamA family outer membrane protein [Candidatus Bipolaricaulota bacterium]